MAANSTYVRWRLDEPRLTRVFPPLTADHPAATAPCAFCREPLADGRFVALVAIGPDDDDNAARHEAGRWHTALAVLAHNDEVAALSEWELALFAAALRPAGELDEEVTDRG